MKYKMKMITLILFVSSTVLCLASYSTAAEDAASRIQRGKYLVDYGGCHDCHTPKNYTEKGPMPDPARLLSGHPTDQKVPEVPSGVIAPGKWSGLTNEHFTLWAGPWGISFASNLTPDMDTGTGSWTEDVFINAMRTGKHLGEGREILPPMPWPNVGGLTNDDLKAIFAYLRTLKPIKNAVPDPVPPQPAK